MINLSSGISTPASSYSVLGEPNPCPQFVDITKEWSYCKIIGEEVADGAPCYEVEWCWSLIPKASIGHPELVAEYEARKARALAC